MSIADVIQGMHRNADLLEAAVSGRSSDLACQEALKAFLMAQYSSLASLAWYLGADGKSFQSEAVPASQIVDEAWFEVNRESEFEPAPRRRQYSAVAVGASL